MAEPQLGAVPFQEAIDFYRQKVRLPTRTWTDIWEGMHARAFVVAGAMRDELVADFHDAVTAAIADGTTLEQFRGQFDKIVAKHGWSYKGGRNWRSAVIFNTNMRMAYAAGRWQQAQRLKARRPYLRYVAVLDARTRPQHRAWHGTVLPMDDPFWATHYPPNGWNCRCSVVTLSGSDLDRYGYQVSPEAPPIEWEDRRLNTASGPVTVKVPKGVDTGFGYNVGQAGFGRGAENIALEEHGEDWRPLVAPGVPQPPLPRLPALEPRAKLGPSLAPDDEAGWRQALRNAIGGDEAVFADPTGDRVTVNQAVVDHILRNPRRQQDRRQGARSRFFPFIPELIEAPQEIWAGFMIDPGSGKVILRRRYIRVIKVDGRETLGLIADATGGMWSGLTFFTSDSGTGAGLRTGVRVYSDRGGE